MPRFRQLGLVFLLLGVWGCGSFGASRKEPFLNLRLASGTDPATVFSVYADGRMMLEHQGIRWARRADAAGLEAMNALVRDKIWQRLLLQVLARQNPEQIVDDLSVIVRSETEDGVIWVRIPVEDIPEDLRPYLLQVDELFRRVYGRIFPLYISSARIVS